MPQVMMPPPHNPMGGPGMPPPPPGGMPPPPMGGAPGMPLGGMPPPGGSPQGPGGQGGMAALMPMILQAIIGHLLSGGGKMGGGGKEKPKESKMEKSEGGSEHKPGTHPQHLLMMAKMHGGKSAPEHEKGLGDVNKFKARRGASAV